MKTPKSKLANLLHNLLGDDVGGTPSPPGSNCRFEFGEPEDKTPNSRLMYIASTEINDGFEIGLGYHHEWHVIYQAKYARQLAWFIIWDWWAKATWFGLKRKIWYSALRIIVGDINEE